MPIILKIINAFMAYYSQNHDGIFEGCPGLPANVLGCPGPLTLTLHLTLPLPLTWDVPGHPMAIVQCVCQRWLHEECICEIEYDEENRELLCPNCAI